MSFTRTSENLLVRREAVFSDCERYRYVLRIKWDRGPVVNFVMLNPSTADEVKSDPTIDKCQKRALALGYGGLVVTNLFALRATDPKVMLADVEPVGPENDQHILREAMDALGIVCAWGQDGNHQGRADFVYRCLAKMGEHKLSALRVSAEPWHPLYLPMSLKPQAYRRPA